MNDLGKTEALIIHLARATARRPQVDRIISACPVPAHILDAVDGQALPEEQISAVYSRKSLHKPLYPFDISVGEIGCFLSHRKAWQAILDRGLDAGLIIEDDVEVNPDVFAHSLALAGQHIAKLGYVQFQTRPIDEAATVVASEGETKLVCPVVAPLRTSAQLVSKEHARHLLQITDRFDRPVDGLLQMSWITSKAMCCAVPSGVRDRTRETGGSTISQKSNLSGKLSREIKRFIYRRNIRLASKLFHKRGGRQ